MSFDKHIQRLIQETVQRVLSPHLEALHRLSVFLGDGRPMRVSKKLPRRNVMAKKVATNSFNYGDVVKYRAGRGEYSAMVLGTSPDGRLKLEREKDGKRVLRPAAKVYN